MPCIQLSEFQSSVLTQSHSEVDVVDTEGTRLGHITCDPNPRATEQPHQSQRTLRHGGRNGGAQQEIADGCVLWCVWGSWEAE